ncbi:MAG: flagellar biosynthesis protein FlhA [Planctomycetes bacterium]|nr:flagellar biosynthesis protein FlhA [Planctomycetota bacterium]NOG53574.1 flagellar biosynthesis protein FlhA [Planctomycetota bacterium]
MANAAPPIPNIPGPVGYATRLANAKAVVVPLGFISLLAIIIVPLPTPIIDILIALNLSVAAITLLTVVYMERPLDFSVFPSLLLSTTLFRLALNIATTRLILTADATTPAEAVGVAGQVIRAFGQFVAGNNPIVGTVIFAILVVVQFVVITKGATRISEVAARFTLDAMPGKQMAIDADLTAGLISEEEAKERRLSITREADFYGAMDGASKFVRGDAIAGIIITLINIVGGFVVGAIYKGWGLGESLEIFTRLTIGDGLVSQIPSFIIAIASGLIVARSGAKDDLSTDLSNQLTSQPRALAFTAAFLVLMSVTGMPVVPMLFCAGTIGGMALAIRRAVKLDVEQKRQAAIDQEIAQRPTAPPVEDLLKVDLLELEVGYALVRLVNEDDGGDLLPRIGMIRRQLAAEFGFVLPPVRIRDNGQLDQHEYRIKIRGAIVATGQTYPGMWLAMDSGMASSPLDGIETKEPAFGLDAWWIEDRFRDRAESFGYTVVDPTSVLITHLTEVVKKHADELLTRQEIAGLIEGLKEQAPKLVEELIPEKLSPALLQKVLQSLLRERVPIRDLETIIETTAEWSAHTKDVDILVEYVRNALRRTIALQYAARDETGAYRLHCATVDPRLEDSIASYIERTATGTTVSVPHKTTSVIAKAVGAKLQPLIQAGHVPVILASPKVRGPLRSILAPLMPTVAVLGYNEVPEGFEVESVGLITADEKELAATAA